MEFVSVCLVLMVAVLHGGKISRRPVRDQFTFVLRDIIFITKKTLLRLKIQLQITKTSNDKIYVNRYLKSMNHTAEVKKHKSIKSDLVFVLISIKLRLY